MFTSAANNNTTAHGSNQLSTAKQTRIEERNQFINFQTLGSVSRTPAVEYVDVCHRLQIKIEGITTYKQLRSPKSLSECVVFLYLGKKEKKQDMTQSAPRMLISFVFQVIREKVNRDIISEVEVGLSRHVHKHFGANCYPLLAMSLQ